MTTAGDPPDDRPAPASESGAVQVQVNGTTVMAEYEVVDGTLLLNSSDFGDASVELAGLRPQVVAARLLREKAEAAMARGGDGIMRDDEANAPETLAWWRKEGDAFRATHAEQQQPKQERTARLRSMVQAELPSAPTGRKTLRGKLAMMGQAKAPAAPAQQLDLVDALAAQKASDEPRGAK